MPASHVVAGRFSRLVAPDDGCASRVVVTDGKAVLEGVDDFTTCSFPERGAGGVWSVHVAVHGELAAT